jgi:predicted transcriptional regulator
MEAVWAAGRPLAVRDVLEALNRGRDDPLAYTTVMTVLSRLAEKGVLHRRLEGRAYLYEAAATDEASIAVRGVLERFGEAAVARFVDEARADPRLRRRLLRLMEDRK